MGTTRVKEEVKKVSEKEEKLKVKRKKEIKVEKAIVRLIDVDVDGRLPIWRAIWKVKGVSFSYGNAVSRVLSLDFNWDINKPIGNLSDEELQLLEDVIKNPQKYGIPSWLYNRRRDRYDGKDYHLVGPEVDIKMNFDIQREIKLNTYRGWRHKLGQPVRGQKTRSHFRTGRTVGVSRSKK